MVLQFRTLVDAGDVTLDSLHNEDFENFFGDLFGSEESRGDDLDKFVMQVRDMLFDATGFQILGPERAPLGSFMYDNASSVIGPTPDPEPEDPDVDMGHVVGGNVDEPPREEVGVDEGDAGMDVDESEPEGEEQQQEMDVDEGDGDGNGQQIDVERNKEERALEKLRAIVQECSREFVYVNKVRKETVAHLKLHADVVRGLKDMLDKVEVEALEEEWLPKQVDKAGFAFLENTEDVGNLGDLFVLLFAPRV